MCFTAIFKDVIFFLTAYHSIVWVRALKRPYLGWSPKYDVQERQVMIYSILMWASVHNTTRDSHYTSLALSRSNNSERQENYLVSVRGSGGGLSKEDGPNPKMYSVGLQDIYSQLICRRTVPVQYGFSMDTGYFTDKSSLKHCQMSRFCSDCTFPQPKNPHLIVTSSI